MRQFANLNKTKENQAGEYRENQLSPITISGVIIPWPKTLNDGSSSDYKLVCGKGIEYLILKKSEVRDILPLYCWKEVKIFGLLNKSNNTLIPQKVLPQGPDGESSNVIDFSLWKDQAFRRKVLNKINELVVMPAAVFTVLVS